MVSQKKRENILKKIINKIFYKKDKLLNIFVYI